MTRFFRSSRKPHVIAKRRRLSCEKLESRFALAVEPVADLAPLGNSNPHNITTVAGSTYFVASDRDAGEELWRTDATSDGTTRVSDIYAGAYGSYPRELTGVGNNLFFRARTADSGYELWERDGTTAVTALVKDILSGTSSSTPSNLTAVGNTLFFVANDGTNGYELWKSGGTDASTVMVKDIRAEAKGAYPKYLTNINGTLFFSSFDDTNGYELWKSDGSPDGTVIVKDIQAGTSSSAPRNLTAVGNTLYFRAFDSTNGYELWKSDGTATGTMLVKDIRSGIVGSYPNYLTNVNGKLFFQSNDGADGYELWTSDGTASGTTLVKDINSGPNGSYPGYLASVNGKLLFTALSPSAGYELWSSDGTTTGTVQVKDIQPGSVSSYPRDIVDVGGIAYFSAADGLGGYELWRSNGIDSGTSLVKDILPGGYSSYPFYLANSNGQLFFRANDGNSGYELFKSDGTQSGTVLVRDIRNISGSYPKYLTDLNGLVIFSANSGGIGAELWKSDGTTNGTTLLKDIRPGGVSSNPIDLTKSGNNVYFRATDKSGGSELWKTDGTSVGTVQVADIRKGLYGSYPKYLTDVNGTLFFVAKGTNSDKSVSGYELWKSDGTASGTVLVKDINPGTSGSYPSLLTNVNGTLFFTAFNSDSGYELWKSNGTSAGTVMVSEIGIGSIGAYLSQLTSVNGTLFFRAYQAGSGYELWKVNGTSTGTVIVKDIRPTFVYNGTTYESSFPSELTNVNGTLFFRAYTYESGYELWKSDGSEMGTVLVKDINSTATTAGSAGSSYPSNLTAIGSKLFFRAYTTTAGYELWSSNGTSAGTMLVRDINPGSTSSIPNSSYPTALKSFQGKLYFQATSSSGAELWQSDGTSVGTALVKDIGSGSNSGSPIYLTPSSNRLFFSADDGVIGRELWSIGDTVGTVSFSASTASVGEGGSQTITVKLTTGGDVLNTPLTVSIVPVGGTATEADYSLPETTVTFPIGSSTGATINVQLNSIQDQIAEGDETISLELQNIIGTGQIDLIHKNQDITIVNDDQASVVVTQDGPLTVNENGTTATFTIALTSLPTSDVTIGFSSSDATQGTVSPTSLVFTKTNGLTPQTVTIKGVDDLIVDGDQLFTIVTAKAQSTDTKYNGLDVSDVSVSNIDNDQASVVVTQAGPLSVTENGTTATFTIALTSLPTSDVTIGLSSSDTSQGTVSPTSLVFTKTNGMTPQTVTIKGVDDLIVDGDQLFTILTAKAQSTDTKYNGLDVSDVSVTNIDNDQASVIVTQAGTLSVTETGTVATFTIALTLLPTSDVTISLSSSNTTQGTVSPSSLVFTPANGTTPQIVTITGVDDLIVDGNQSFSIVTSATASSQANYNGLAVEDVVLTSVDDGRRPYQNPSNRLDANDDTKVNALDALVIINDIARRKTRILPNIKAAGEFFYDTNGDGKAAPLDALVVINAVARMLKQASGSGESESIPVATAVIVAAEITERSDDVNKRERRLDELIDLLATDARRT